MLGAFTTVVVAAAQLNMYPFILPNSEGIDRPDHNSRNPAANTLLPHIESDGTEIIFRICTHASVGVELRKNKKS